MKSSNPVLSRISAAAQQPRYTVPGQGAPAGYPAGGGYPEVVQSGHVDRMTIDDVVVKTVTLLATTAALAAITWITVPLEITRPLLYASMFLGVIVGLVISFAQVTNAAVIVGYAVIEGVFLGLISRAFEHAFEGIVLQAVIATLSVFLAMAALYKMKIIRATPKFMKIVIGAAAGLGVVMLVNFVIYLITDSVGPLRDGGPLAIGFSLVCIVVAALMFVVNFKQIEDGIAAGLPRKYGWLGAFGILVELVWLYLEILRLISYFSED
ncbi:Bax inhibitor-1/YccA family protein [Catellatospora citrea]|uniref:Membrane protein n=1 Tax=Catellatospora citrea TaxID=53366 RepID=A0A8J3NZN7_9ACTN|nr:Bax inhibitor-1/YccA family protein [Catellatospora citrea]RKE08121.1 putative YccA/Bax inhibitor family protein [Catellatospora citrea]GIF98502.1 membrane protein [Catellatospora citrea]